MTARYTRTAIRQTEDILQFLASEDQQAGAAAARRLEALAAVLSSRPNMGRATDLEGVRVFRATPYPYLVFNRIDGPDQITVLRIRHTARDLDWRSGR